MKARDNSIKRGLPIGVLIVVFLLGVSQATVSFAQDTQRGNYRIDRSTQRYKELEIGFQLLYGELTHRSLSSVNESDEGLVHKAVTETPYFAESVQLTIDACNEFESLEESQVDTAHIMQLLARSSEWEYEGKEIFLESLYLGLSPSAKVKFDSIISEQSHQVARLKPSSFDHAEYEREQTRDTVIELVNRICGRIPILIEKYGSGTIESSESTIDWRFGQ